MSFTIVHTQLWMSLPVEIREHLAKTFGIERNGIREIRDQTVISDGFKQEDLLGFTASKMAEYVGSEEPFPRLWELTIAKAKYELNPPLPISNNHVAFVATENVVIEPITEITSEPLLESLPAEPSKNAKSKKSK